jgi:hyaluronan synthase
MNRTQNLITRITDLEISYGSFTIRRAKSSLGAVCPTSGALAVYRAHIFADNIDDYLTDTYSDDRRLSHQLFPIIVSVPIGNNRWFPGY